MHAHRGVLQHDFIHDDFEFVPLVNVEKGGHSHNQGSGTDPNPPSTKDISKILLQTPHQTKTEQRRHDQDLPVPKSPHELDRFARGVPVADEPENDRQGRDQSEQDSFTEHKKTARSEAGGLKWRAKRLTERRSTSERQRCR